MFKRTQKVPGSKSSKIEVSIALVESEKSKMSQEENARNQVYVTKRLIPQDEVVLGFPFGKQKELFYILDACMTDLQRRQRPKC